MITFQSSQIRSKMARSRTSTTFKSKISATTNMARKATSSKSAQSKLSSYPFPLPIQTPTHLTTYSSISTLVFSFPPLNHLIWIQHQHLNFAQSTSASQTASNSPSSTNSPLNCVSRSGDMLLLNYHKSLVWRILRTRKSCVVRRPGAHYCWLARRREMRFWRGRLTSTLLTFLVLVLDLMSRILLKQKHQRSTPTSRLILCTWWFLDKVSMTVISPSSGRNCSPALKRRSADLLYPIHSTSAAGTTWTPWFWSLISRFWSWLLMPRRLVMGMFQRLSCRDQRWDDDRSSGVPGRGWRAVRGEIWWITRSIMSDFGRIWFFVSVICFFHHEKCEQIAANTFG